MSTSPFGHRSVRAVRGPVAAALITGLALVGAGCASGEPTAASAAESVPAGSVECTYTPSEEAAAKAATLPAAIEPATGAASATVHLTGGTLEIDLDRTTAPCTVGSFVHLAQAGYYNDSPCHRLTASATLSVLQCGDPSGTGGGGPGYTFPDETNPQMRYPAGTVAMANAGPDTNGSQFFLVYQDSTLPPDYTVFGTITAGLDVITGIAAQGITGSGNATAPVQPVTISAVTING